ncbi:hypothetical protein PQR02_14565 [Paraburkholderia sediminicola]|uniref:Uncharacterized protein n=1 Tax=Paraburkholderia rhynchosiae TaxID=487049 RepID=A0ACC7N895_9BURK
MRRVQCEPSRDRPRRKEIDGLRVHAFEILRGCVMGYYPECNRVIPLSHHAKQSLVPTWKSIPVRLRKSTGADERVAA